VDSACEKLCSIDQKVSKFVEKVSAMAITMQNLDDRGATQTKIDSIFRESPLPFEDYEETEIILSDKLRKYVNMKNRGR